MKLGICYLGRPFEGTDFFGGVRAVRVHPLIIIGLKKARREIKQCLN